MPKRRPSAASNRRPKQTKCQRQCIKMLVNFFSLFLCRAFHGRFFARHFRLVHVYIAILHLWWSQIIGIKMYRNINGPSFFLRLSLHIFFLSFGLRLSPLVTFNFSMCIVRTIYVYGSCHLNWVNIKATPSIHPFISMRVNHGA